MSGKCFCSPGAPVAAAGGTLSTGHHSRCVQLLCCSPALHGACSASRLRSPGGALKSRESLTQDSRSAVKARLFDPLRESFGGERCTPCRADESLTQDSRSTVKARPFAIRYA